MASLDHDRLRARLAALAAADPPGADRLLVRSALMWLCAAARPLRAHELWIALRVEESTDLEHVERLLSEPEYVDEQAAAAALRRLLGDLVAFAPADDDGAVVVSLCDPELRTVLTHRGGAGPLGFSAARAHVVAASVCMVVCSASTLRLAHAHDGEAASALVVYAWDHWAAHLARSGYPLSDPDAAGLFDSMAYRVAVDVLVFLLAVGDVATGPVTLPAGADRLAATAAVREAQKALEAPILTVASLVRLGKYSGVFQAARDVVGGAGRSAAGGKARDIDGRIRAATLSRTSSAFGDLPRAARRGAVKSKVELLRMDPQLRTALNDFGETERRVVLGFAEAARGLRSVCVALSGAPLYGELLEQYGGGWSPTDVLVYAANWMETVASYPFWEDLPTGSLPSDPFHITDTTDPSYSAAALIKSRVRRITTSSRSPSPSQALPISGLSTRPSHAPSSLRFRTAAYLDKLQSLRHGAHDSTYTLNDVRFLSKRMSSFARVPSQLHGAGEPLDRLWLHMPNTLKRFARRYAAPALDRLTSRTFLQPLDDFGSSAFTGGMTALWPRAKAAILADGYRWAAVYFAVAILAHHVRRVLVPWLAAYQHHSPVEDLRLVLSRADLFLDDALAVSWPYVAFMYLQKLACDAAGALAMGVLALEPPAAGPGAGRSRAMARVLSAARVAYLAWSLSCAEYMVDRSANTAAFAVAYWRLLARGSSADRAALARVLRAHWTKVPLSLWQLHHYATRGVGPVAQGAVACAAAGQPGLLAALGLAVAAVWAVLRFRSRLFIFIEMGGLFVVLGSAAVVAVLLAAEFVDDPLGFKDSTGRARRVLGRARGALPRGAATRTGILRPRVSVAGPRRRAGRGAGD